MRTSKTGGHARSEDAGLDVGIAPSTRNTQYFVILFVFIGLILYLGLLSNHYDRNGLIEAEAVEAGGTSLFSPNHLLYRPAVWLLYQMMRTFGFAGRAVFPAQIVTAVAASLGLGLFFVWAQQLTRSTRVAILAALGFGTSWAYWVFSVDAYYITPAAAVVLGALICLTAAVRRPSDWKWPLAAAGLLTGCAVLLWQANIFLIPSVIIVLALRYHRNRRDLLMSLLLYIGITIAVIGLGYLLGSFAVLGQDWTLQGFLTWPTGHNGGSLSIWGQLNATRLTPAAHSMLSSFIPVWEGLGLRDLLNGELQIDKLLRLAALPALALLILFPLGAGILGRSLSGRRLGLIGLLAVGYLMYMPFFVWWDPFEPKWLVIPLIAAWAIIALLWATPAVTPRFTGVFAIFVLFIGLANFTASIWPHHALPDKAMEEAECIAHHMQKEDLLLSIDWGNADLAYFFDRNILEPLAVFAEYGDKEASLIEIQNTIRATQQNGQVYFMDSSQTEVAWIILRSSTGINQADFAFLHGDYSFTCNEMRYRVLDKAE